MLSFGGLSAAYPAYQQGLEGNLRLRKGQQGAEATDAYGATLGQMFEGQAPPVPGAPQARYLGPSQQGSGGMPSSVAGMPAELGPVFVQAAKKYGVDPSLLMRVAKQESGFRNEATSPKGAAGMMQFMPATAQRFGIDPRNPVQAVDAAANYIAQNAKMFDGNIGLALAGYNWGEGNVQKWLKAGGDPARAPAETQDYVLKITGKPLQAWLSMGGAQPAQAATAPQAPVQEQPPTQVAGPAMAQSPQSRYLGPSQQPGASQDLGRQSVDQAPQGVQMPQVSPQMQGRLGWAQVVNAVKKANPNLSPGALGMVVDQMMPLMNQESQEYWKQQAAQRQAQQDAQARGKDRYRPVGGNNVFDTEKGAFISAPAPAAQQQKQTMATSKAATAFEQAELKWKNLDSTLDQAIAATDPKGGILPAAGFGAVASKLPYSNAQELATLLDTIRANIGFSELQAMRNASPTGGALGQVSDFENRLLQSLQGSTDQWQDPKILATKLAQIRQDIKGLREITRRSFQRDFPNVEVAPQAGEGQGQQPPASPGGEPDMDAIEQEMRRRGLL